MGRASGEREYVGEAGLRQEFFVHCTIFLMTFVRRIINAQSAATSRYGSLTSCLLGRKVGYAMLGYDLSADLALS